MANTDGYLCLVSTPDSQFDFKNSQEVLSYLNSLSKRISFKLKIVSYRGKICLYIQVDKAYINSLKQHIAATCGLAIEQVKYSELAINRPTLINNYHLTKHYAYPLVEPSKTTDQLSKLMNQIMDIKNNETIELSLSSTASLPIKARVLRRRLLSGQNPTLYDPSVRGYILKSLSSLALLVVLLLKSLLYLLSSLASVSRASKQRAPISSRRSVMLLDKLYEPLFKTNFEVAIKAASPKRAKQISENLALSLRNFASNSGYQDMNPVDRARYDLFSLSDLAGLFHISPEASRSSTYKSLNHKTLPLASELSGRPQVGDILLGYNNYHALQKPIVLSSEARKRHLYILGATGSGKSTLLANLISQDLSANQGLTLIDPHGDLAQEVIKHFPDSRLKDLIYFDPINSKYSHNINLLNISAKPSDPNFKFQADRVSESLISLFNKLFKTENNNHRIEYILRNSIQSALYLPDADIFTIFRLLTDSNYRLKALPQITNPDLVNFWRNELGRAGDYQRVKMTAGVTAKVGRFLFSEPTKRAFSGSKNSLDFKQILDDKKILICNFAKGKLGEDGSNLFATSVLTRLQLTALERASLASSSRQPHYLYIDEFQSYLPEVIVRMLAESRKYGLYLTMAEQSPGQQDIGLTNQILTNAANLICFRTPGPKDSQILLPSFNNSITAQDLGSLPLHQFYLKSSAPDSLPPTSGEALPLNNLNTDNKEKVRSSKIHYARAT